MQLRSSLKWLGAGALVVFVAGSASAQNTSYTFEAVRKCDPGVDCDAAAIAEASRQCQAAGCQDGCSANIKVQRLTSGDGTAAGSVAARAIATGTKCKNPSGGGDAQVGVQQRQNLSPQDQLKEAESSIARMEQGANVVRRQLAAAREAHDVVKTLCLNDKLSQIDVAIRSARERKASHATAVQRNDVELGTHEFTILTVLRQRGEQLTAEANQCLGEDLSFIGKTEVITQVDPTLPGNDQTEYPPTDPTIVSSPPVCVSCSGK